MPFDNHILSLSIISIPFFVIVIIDAIYSMRRLEVNRLDSTSIILLIFNLIPWLGIIYAYLIYQNNKSSGIIIYCLINISFLFSTIMVNYIDDIKNKFILTIFIISTSFPFLMGIIAVSNVYSLVQNNNYEEIERYAYKIEKQLDNEIKGITIVMKQYIKRINSEKNNLTQLELNIKQLKHTEEMYRNLASISKKEAEAILNNMKRHKHINHIMGFILGCLSTLFTTYILKKFRWF